MGKNAKTKTGDSLYTLAIVRCLVCYQLSVRVTGPVCIELSACCAGVPIEPFCVQTNNIFFKKK